MHNRFNNPNVVWFATAKLPSKTLVLCPAKSMLCCPAIMEDKSFENMFCRLMQNLYSSTGTTPNSEQAKKPFNTFIAVVLIFALPF